MAANTTTTQLTAPRVYLSPKQVAEMLNVPVKTVCTWNSEDTGPKYKTLGRDVRYIESDVHAWVDAQRSRR